MKRSLISLLLLVVVLLASCKTDDNSGIDYKLDGNWEIYEAYRDGDLTTTLEDGYFNFQDTLMETNILGSPISGTYSIEDRSVKHQSTLPITYTIAEYSGDTMHLETEIRGFDFLFRLRKLTDSIQ